MDTPMQSPTGSSISGKPPHNAFFSKKMVFWVFVLVLLAGIAIYMFWQQPEKSSVFTEDDRQALMNRIEAESAAVTIPESERSAALDRIEKEKTTTTLSEAERQKIIDRIAAEAKN